MATGFKVSGENCTDSGLQRNPPITVKNTQYPRPLGDRVLVRVTEAKEVLKNGILIPDNAVEKPQEGEVLAVGNGRIFNGERVPVDVEVGDIILFGKYSGNDIECMGAKLLILQENEIQAVW